MTPLVSADWLVAQLSATDAASDGPRVFDASWFLPGDTRDARAAFRAAHIPGAGFFDLDALADVDSGLPHMVPAAGRFERLVGELGIGNTTRLVFYDQQGMFSAPRAWWLMRLFGHEPCAVLDGGLPEWQRRGLPLEQGEGVAVPAQRYRARLHAQRLRGLGDLLDNLGTHAELVVDARSRERFIGRATEPRPGVRAGHIPGSHNLPYTELLSAEGRLEPPEQLRRRFAACGVGADSRVVTCCGSGMTAALLTLGLAVAGWPAGALYDGSWTEWGGHPDTPIATGPEDGA